MIRSDVESMSEKVKSLGWSTSEGEDRRKKAGVRVREVVLKEVKNDSQSLWSGVWISKLSQNNTLPFLGQF